jgi:predicted transcriptional regulator
MTQKSDSLKILPEFNKTEKKVYTFLLANGASSFEDILSIERISRRHAKKALTSLQEYGFVQKIHQKIDGVTTELFFGIFPIENIRELINDTISNLSTRQEELISTSDRAKDFTQNIIQQTLETSQVDEKKDGKKAPSLPQRRRELLITSLNETEQALMENLNSLQQLKDISTQMFTESEIRAAETCTNISHELQPLFTQLQNEVKATTINIASNLEKTVDERVEQILKNETNTHRALDEVLDAFKESQDAFEEIIFNILDAGIEDLEKVTRPINEQIETAITSLTNAIQISSRNFQREILRVLTEQKRPMISSVDTIRPQLNMDITETHEQLEIALRQNLTEIQDKLTENTQFIVDLTEQQTSEFENNLTKLVEESFNKISEKYKQLDALLEQFEETSQTSNETFQSEIQKNETTLNKQLEIASKRVLNKIEDSIIDLENNLLSSLSKVKERLLLIINNHSTNLQNLINYLSMSLTEPMKSCINAQIQENKKIIQNIQKTIDEQIASQHKTRNEIQEELLKEQAKTIDNFQNDGYQLNLWLQKETENDFNSFKANQNRKWEEIQQTIEDVSVRFDQDIEDFQQRIQSQRQELKEWEKTQKDRLTNKLELITEKRLELLENKSREFLEETLGPKEVTMSDWEVFVGSRIEELQKEVLHLKSGILDSINESLNNTVESFIEDQQRDVLNTEQIISSKEKSLEKIKRNTEDYFKFSESHLEDFHQETLKKVSNLLKNHEKALGMREQQFDDVFTLIFEKNEEIMKKRFDSLKTEIEQRIEDFENKTQINFKQTIKTLEKSGNNLLDKEEQGRESIIELLRKTIKGNERSINEFKEETLDEINSEVTQEAKKTTIIIKDFRENLVKESNDYYQEAMEDYRGAQNQVKNHIDDFDKKISELQKEEIISTRDNRDEIITKIRNANKKEISNMNSSFSLLQEKMINLSGGLKTLIDSSISQAIQELEIHTAGIEGAIYDSVEKITAEASRQTEEVGIVGEQAVLDIEERYTENLERIRQNLTNEVINRIEEESLKLQQHKKTIREMGRKHLEFYGEAMMEVNQEVQKDLRDVQNVAKRITNINEAVACKFLTELQNELEKIQEHFNRMYSEISTHLGELFQTSLKEVQRNSEVFIKKQRKETEKKKEELSQTYQELAEDIEEAITKQINSYQIRTAKILSRTVQFMEQINEYLQNLTQNIETIN